MTRRKIAPVPTLSAGSVGNRRAGLSQAADVDPGFRADGVAAVQLFVYGDRYRESAQQVAFFDRLLEEIGALPGVPPAAPPGSIRCSRCGEAEGVGAPL